MSGIATAIVGSAVVGAVASSAAGRKQAGAARDAAQMEADAKIEAAQIQSDSAREGREAQKEALDRQIALNKPYYDVGVGAVNRLASQAPYMTDTFNFQEDPGYAFRFKEGMRALNSQAAARSGLISGNALRAATAFGQDMSSQEYQNAFTRYLQNNAQNLNTYNTNTGLQQYLTNVGQASANNQSNAMGVYGTNLANNLIGVGNANAGAVTGAAAANAAGAIGAANAGASGLVGTTNALTGGLGTYINYNQNQNLLNAFNNNNKSAYLSNQYGYDNIYGRGFGGTIPSTVNPYIG
jgi:hypothetical protein